MKETPEYQFVYFAQIGDLARMKQWWEEKKITNIDCYGLMGVRVDLVLLLLFI